MEWTEIGLLGLFFVCFLSATILPFSSEIVFIGFLSAGFSPVSSIFFAGLGNTAGGMTSYGLGWLGDEQKILKYLRINSDRIHEVSPMVSKLGQLSALLTWLPFVGDIIAILLGLFKYNWVKTAFLMATGKTIRYVVLFYLHALAAN